MAGGDSVSDSGCNLELTLGGSYGGDEIPVLTLSSSVFESDDAAAVNEGFGESDFPAPDGRAFLSLRMTLQPPAMSTIKELQTMRRLEVKKRLMGRNRRRAGRPPLPNRISHNRFLLPPTCHPPASPLSFRLSNPSSTPLKPWCPSPVSFSCMLPTPATSPPPLSFRFPPQCSNSLPLCPMPLSIVRPRRLCSSPPLSPRPSSFRVPSPAPPPEPPSSPLVPVPTNPHFPAYDEDHKVSTPCQNQLPVEIPRAPLVVKWLLQHKYRRLRASSDTSDIDTGLDLIIKQMPTVAATGARPDGKRIEGFLCKLGTGEVSLVCICHGMFFTPTEFVKHAGGDHDHVHNPMKQIIVPPSSF